MKIEKWGIYSYHGNGILCIDGMTVDSYVEGVIRLSQVIYMIEEFRRDHGTKEYYNLSDEFKMVLKYYYNMLMKILRDNNIYNYIYEQEYLYDMIEYGEKYINFKPYLEIYNNEVYNEIDDLVFTKKK